MANCEKIENAVVKRVTLERYNDTLLTSWVDLDYGGAGQGFGGYALGDKFTHEWINSLMHVFGVERWEDITGKPCRVVTSGGSILRIGNFLTDVWFDPKEAVRRLKSMSDED